MNCENIIAFYTIVKTYTLNYFSNMLLKQKILFSNPLTRKVQMNVNDVIKLFVISLVLKNINSINKVLYYDYNKK